MRVRVFRVALAPPFAKRVMSILWFQTDPLGKHCSKCARAAWMAEPRRKQRGQCEERREIEGGRIRGRRKRFSMNEAVNVLKDWNLKKGPNCKAVNLLKGQQVTCIKAVNLEITQGVSASLARRFWPQILVSC